MSVSYRIQPNFASVPLSLSLLADPNLSAPALGLLCFVHTLAHANHQFSEDVVLARWNASRPREKHIGADRFRRLVNEWKLAGYVSEDLVTSDDGRVSGRVFNVLPESPKSDPAPPQVPPQTKSTAKIPLHKFPAAQIFQEIFGVTLDLDSLKHIEKQIGKDYRLWTRVCGDHYSSLTEQQKDSISYKTKALKFCLGDFRREVELAAIRGTKTPMRNAAADANLPEQKKKTFADYADKYDYGSDAYNNLKRNWLARAHEVGNEEAIEQVNHYEGLKRSVAAVKARKGGVKK